MTKYVVCVPDGCADEPFDGLDGKTPLEVARMPNLDKLCEHAELGRAAVIPEGMPPGSDIGNMSIFGYDPHAFHTGRAPIEAAALKLRLNDDQIAFRCNLVTVENGTMVDFAGGHPSSEVAAEMIAALDAELGSGSAASNGVAFHPGVQYRHIMVAPNSWMDTECVPPHDLTDDPIVLPTGNAGAWVADMMERSRGVLSQFGQKANQIWLWGQGPQPTLTSFQHMFGKSAALVTAVDLVRGLGVLADLDILEVEGATGWFDTNYENKRDAAIDALNGGADVAIIHVEATDEAGHAGNSDEKVRALECWDERILADLVPELNAMGHWRMLMLPDHATPLRTKTHSSDPVPFMLYDSEAQYGGGIYTEAGVADANVVSGHSLMRRLLQH